MHDVLVNRLGGLSLPRKSVTRLNDWPDMIISAYHGHKTTTDEHVTDMAMAYVNLGCVLN